jgi:hypothetical protein
VTAEPHAEHGPEEVARGVAKVGKAPGVKAVAPVPGALPVRRRGSRRLPRLASPSMVFPRRVYPVATAVAVPPRPAPALRKAAPPEPGDAPPVVPEEGLLRRLALPALTALAAAFATGTGYLAFVADRPPDRNVARWGAVAETVSAERPAGDPFRRATEAPAGTPSRVRVGVIGVDSPLEQLHLGATGVLVPPRASGRAGWYADGTAPGDTGPAVIAGHVDSKTGPAVFYRLRELAAGDRIEVVRGGRVIRFTVTRTRWYPKSRFPTAEVYGPTPDRQLRLITCGGAFDRSLRSYRDNLVVYAVAG